MTLVLWHTSADRCADAAVHRARRGLVPARLWRLSQPNHADEEWEDYSVEILSGADTLLFGRKTYEGFAAFWPSQEGEVARLLNEIDKAEP